MALRLAAVGIVALTLLAGAPAVASAQQTTESVLVRGRVYFGYAPVTAHTRFTALVVYGAVPGSQVAVGCRPAVPGRSCGVGSVARTAPDTGLLDLRADVTRGRFRPGDALEVSITDVHGRRKVGSLQARSREGPLLSFRCFDPSGREVSCRVTCTVGAVVAPGDPCEGAGQRSRIGRFGGRWHAFWGRRGTRFTRLRLSGLPDQIQVLLLCDSRGRGDCPLQVRVVPFSGGTADIAQFLRGLRFPAGVWLEVQFIEANKTVDIVRFMFRDRRRPRVTTLCQDPGRPEKYDC